MKFARMRESLSALVLVTISITVAGGAVAKDPPAPKGVQCCGLLLRTDFGLSWAND